MQWEPESAFARIHKELDARFSMQTADMKDEVLAELLAMIEVVNKEGMVEKELLFAMLKSLGSYAKILEAHG